MFFDLLTAIINYDKQTEQGIKLNEALTKAEMDVMRDEIATPEILPCTFDVTIPGWLARIEFWGKVIIHHKDPENFWGKHKVTQGQFLDRISDDSLNKVLGKFSIVKKGLTSCEFQRDYIGQNDKHFQERFIIDVKLKSR